MKSQRQSDFLFWLLVLLGTAAAGGFFGLLAAGGSGILLGTIIAGAIATPVVSSAAILTWAFWLTRFRTIVAAASGACVGVLSTIAIPLPLIFRSFAINYLLAGAIGAVGAGLFAGAYDIGHSRVLHSDARPGRTAWRFSLRDVFVRFAAISLLLAGWTILITLLRTGLSGAGFYDQLPSESSGYVVIPQAKQIDDLLGPARHYWSNFSSRGRVQWFTETIFPGRYELTMWADVEYEPETGKILRVIGEPRFRLQEIEAVHGNQALYSKGVEFGASAWQRVADAKGDFSVIGIEVDRANVIPGFAAYQNLPRNGVQFKASTRTVVK
jgi:hypothetical protein